METRKKERIRDKKLNLFSEKDDSLKLFSLSKVQAAYNFAYDKKIEKKQQKKDVEEKKKE